MKRELAFVFLQGPPGPLFEQLGAAIADTGTPVYRINLSGGDRYDWPNGAIDFRGRFADWPVFFDKFLREHRITDLVLFGDCRPYHVSAHGMAELRGVRTHVLEEGYLRPDWMTFELEGVNARSSLSRDKTWFRQEAMRLPGELPLPSITASFARRARDSYWHFHHVLDGRFRYPHYRSHRSGSILMEGFGWLWRFARSARRERAATKTVRMLDGKRLFLFPLQLSGDYQIRAHSPFADMQSAASYVIESFAAYAAPEDRLLLKAHPLDSSFYNWGKFVRRHANRLGLNGRLHFIDGGDLETLVKTARGLVCVNSTSATLALAAGTPVCTVGDAIYDMPGLTHQEHLDRFWGKPIPPEPGLYPAFRRVLVDRCLVRGGLASESAVNVLIGSILERLELNELRKATARRPQNDRSRSADGMISADAIVPREPRSSVARNLG
ncbi:MAG TPA: capsular biosynthesis protein [Sphingomicrobium sp.]|nr:capsular biosynthesis protein [Sphingomicrobium sp.]